MKTFLDKRQENGASSIITKPKQLDKNVNKIVDNNRPIDVPTGNILMHDEKSSFGITYMFSQGHYYISPQTTNVLIYGLHCSGVIPMLINPKINLNSRATGTLRKSMIINDPTGKLYQKWSNKLDEHGYNIRALNLRDENGDYPLTKFQYNPLTDVITNVYNNHLNQAENICDKVSYNIISIQPSIYETKVPQIAVDVLTKIILKAIIDKKKQHYNLKQTEQEITLAKLITYINKFDKTTYKKLNQKWQIEPKILGSAMGIILDKLSIFTDKTLANVVARTTFNIKDLYNVHPVAIFLETSNKHTETNKIASIFISQLMDKIIKNKYQNKKNLPYSLQIILAPMGNLSPILDLSKYLSIDLATHVSFIFDFQNEEQIEMMFGKSLAMTIISNCAMIYYVLSNSDQTIQQISNAIGKNEIVKYQKVNGKMKVKKHPKPVISPNKLKHLHRGEVIIISTNDLGKDHQESRPLPIFTTGHNRLPYK